MANPLVTNNAYSTLASSITDVDTSLSVQTGEGGRFPAISGSDYFYATLIDTSNNMEIVKVTARSTDTFTIERGADNTTARAFSASDRIELRPVAALFEDLLALTSAVSDGAKGDVTVSSSGATWTITQATLAALRALTGAADKIAMFTSSSAATLLDFKDEDNMASDSATAIPSQQSVKAYVDANGGAPAGSVIPFAGTSAPTGWLLCYGQAINRTTYAALFAVIGTTYGIGDGSTTFNLPDMRGRVVAGKDNMGGTSANRLTDQTGGVNGDVLGDTGGSETHTLTEAQLPEHAHELQPFTSHSSGGSARFGAGPDTYNRNTGGVYIDSQGAGSDEAHNNVQPTIILNYIIKT